MVKFMVYMFTIVKLPIMHCLVQLRQVAFIRLVTKE